MSLIRCSFALFLVFSFDVSLLSAPKITEDLVYAVRGGVELKLDLAQPETEDKKRPALVLIHGGGWRRGSPEGYRPVLEEAARQGYVAIAIAYRLAPQFRWPAQWEDVRDAVFWLRAHADDYGIDPSRIGAVGASAGGHLSLLLGTYPVAVGEGHARVQAVVNYFGPTLLNGEEFPERARKIITNFIGGSAMDKPEEYKLASPLTHVSASDAPVLTFHGTADDLVPVKQAQRLHEALTALRVPNTMELLDGRGHGWDGEDVKSTQKRMFAFFDRYLKVSDLPLVAVEDFEQGADRWQPTDTAAWKVVMQDRSRAFYSLVKKRSDYEPKVRSPYNYTVLRDVEVSDFVLDVRIQSTTPDYVHRDLCLFFGFQSPSNFYYVHLGKRADAHANSIFLVNDKPRVSIAKERTNGTNWDDHWHRVRVVRDTESGTIEVYFDDMAKPVMTTVDKTFLHGRVGVGSFDDTGNFDSVRLWGRKHER